MCRYMDNCYEYKVMRNIPQNLLTYSILAVSSTVSCYTVTLVLSCVINRAALSSILAWVLLAWILELERYFVKSVSCDFTIFKNIDKTSYWGTKEKPCAYLVWLLHSLKVYPQTFCLQTNRKMSNVNYIFELGRLLRKWFETICSPESATASHLPLYYNDENPWTF